MGDPLDDLEEMPLSKDQKEPFMLCECGVKIKCVNLMEAEQRARIHMTEVPQHKATWSYLN